MWYGVGVLGVLAVLVSAGSLLHWTGHRWALILLVAIVLVIGAVAVVAWTATPAAHQHLAQPSPAALTSPPPLQIVQERFSLPFLEPLTAAKAKAAAAAGTGCVVRGGAWWYVSLAWSGLVLFYTATSWSHLASPPSNGTASEARFTAD